MKFKVGDKVRVLEEESILFGKDSVVIGVTNTRVFPYEVEREDGYSIFKEEDLELIEESKESLIDELKKLQYKKPIITFSKGKKPSIVKIKDIRLDKLKQLIKSVNTLGEFGKEVELKITIELDGKKIEL